ncbi:hypothetical protein ACSLBF_00175 [Pseudoalteromonas sp. T1lg65]|uniref:hypothetical protein n=1 Tax=Pseudoalteromonas sp. T1lg65 TaxID=2077101 RepID=UPI003F799F8D
MSVYLIFLLVIFALFGTAASYFVRFIYSYWVKKQVESRFMLNAAICAALIMFFSLVLELIK